MKGVFDVEQLWSMNMFTSEPELMLIEEKQNAIREFNDFSDVLYNYKNKLTSLSKINFE